ncbi:MAG TPA: acetyl-CoA carboxylase carboxyltransferase subunit alpha [Planctomycetes bacterium]|nr:acetyl-CoA carboxylase carboxyltransferase subunit alpha [Planctomycetota bacterium]
MSKKKEKKAQRKTGSERKPEGILGFERPILEMENKIQELKTLAQSTHLNLNGEVTALEERLRKVTSQVYERLTPWERVNVARHPDRPVTSDYIAKMLDDFVELHGDRLFADDPAIVTGLATMEGRRFLLVGHRKGKTVKERLLCNFGCAHPEGYRKAMEKMRLAERLGLPIVTLINTPGAYPGIGAEERGQARAIAYNIREMFGLKVPILALVIGEGGSGGALGIGVGDRVGILQYAYYSVISPEGCAAILWKSGDKAPEAAEALKLTAPDLVELGIVDDVVQEPLGGAHRDPALTISHVKEWILTHLDRLSRLSTEELLEGRYRKFRNMGEVRIQEPAASGE